MFYSPDNTQSMVTARPATHAGRITDFGPRGYRDPRMLTTPLGSGFVSLLEAQLLQAAGAEGSSGYTLASSATGAPDIEGPPATDFSALLNAIASLTDAMRGMDYGFPGAFGQHDEAGEMYQPPLQSPAQQVIEYYNREYNTTVSETPGVHDLPSGGATNEVLAKNTATNYDADWGEVKFI